MTRERLAEIRTLNEAEWRLSLHHSHTRMVRELLASRDALVAALRECRNRLDELHRARLGVARATIAQADAALKQAGEPE
jgi:hypothetical protein